MPKLSASDKLQKREGGWIESGDATLRRTAPSLSLSACLSSQCDLRARGGLCAARGADVTGWTGAHGEWVSLLCCHGCINKRALLPIHLPPWVAFVVRLKMWLSTHTHTWSNTHVKTHWQIVCCSLEGIFMKLTPQYTLTDIAVAECLLLAQLQVCSVLVSMVRRSRERASDWARPIRNFTYVVSMQWIHLHVWILSDTIILWSYKNDFCAQRIVVSTDTHVYFTALAEIFWSLGKFGMYCIWYIYLKFMILNLIKLVIESKACEWESNHEICQNPEKTAIFQKQHYSFSFNLKY